MGDVTSSSTQIHRPFFRTHRTHKGNYDAEFIQLHYDAEFIQLPAVFQFSNIIKMGSFTKKNQISIQWVCRLFVFFKRKQKKNHDAARKGLTEL